MPEKTNPRNRVRMAIEGAYQWHLYQAANGKAGLPPEVAELLSQCIRPERIVELAPTPIHVEPESPKEKVQDESEAVQVSATRSLDPTASEGVDASYD